MNYVIPEIKRQGKKSFMYNGVKLWSILPVSIKLIEVKEKCKRSVKKLFFNLMEKIDTLVIQYICGI